MINLFSILKNKRSTLIYLVLNFLFIAFVFLEFLRNPYLYHPKDFLMLIGVLIFLNVTIYVATSKNAAITLTFRLAAYTFLFFLFTFPVGLWYLLYGVPIFYILIYPLFLVVYILLKHKQFPKTVVISALILLLPVIYAIYAFKQEEGLGALSVLFGGGAFLIFVIPAYLIFRLLKYIYSKL